MVLILHESRSAAPVPCNDPVYLDNGKVTLISTYTCDAGFELVGDAATSCSQVDMGSAELEPAPPFCRRECSE